jgi:hypothetical protein
MTPALSIFLLYFAVVITACFFSQAFYVLTAVLTFITMMWISNMALSSLYGAYRLRRDTEIDWNAKLEAAQDASPDGFDVIHIVILPNFRENERMLEETLENLGTSPMALDRVHIVLAMEAREGPAGQEKAERLIQKGQHLFADIFATYHPENLPGEVAGKSSNTQFAYREALRRYGHILKGCDLSRVFLTVGDADTLFHPQYLSALTYSGMNMTSDERSWRIWQSPVLLLRNLSTVPAVTRASAHATIIFELSALSNQLVFPAFAYSSYSMSLALACHPEVDGWDVDVIAEDHHMFCKCYFAALWELAHASREEKKRAERSDDSEKKLKNVDIEIRPQVKVQPIFLPSVSYLVESSDGYLASIWARFQQARRHMHGVVELGYVLLQYTRLTSTVGFMELPFRTHLAIMLIVTKMLILHIISTAQCLALQMATGTAVAPAVLSWVTSGGIYSIFRSDAVGFSSQISDGWGALNFAQQALAASFGQISGVSVLYSLTAFVVCKDLIEGRYHRVLGRPNIVGAMPPMAEDDENTEGESSTAGTPIIEAASPPDPEVKERRREQEFPPGCATFMRGVGSWRWRILFGLSILADTVFVGYSAITFLAMIPVFLAAWSLFRRGMDFEYIVAPKPE